MNNINFYNSNKTVISRKKEAAGVSSAVYALTVRALELI